MSAALIHCPLPVSAAAMVAAGGGFTVALKADGALWVWGGNNFGELGNGTTTFSTTPQLLGFAGAQSVAAGGHHTVVLKVDGTVWAWGYNPYGQLGNGSTVTTTTPVQTTGLSGVQAVAAGGTHTVALKADGTVWAWGYNGNGQLGNGSTVNANTPVQVVGLTGVQAISAGNEHTVALKSDGTVWAWGYGAYGQLGNGGTVNSSTPVQVAGLAGVQAVAGGGGHTVALKADGTVWAWGSNDYGELGNGTTVNSSTPVQVVGLTGVQAITASYHTVALKTDGTLWAWGNNIVGELGNGSTVNASTPVQVVGLTGVQAVAAGYEHTVALKADGTLWAWGSNGAGQLGNGSMVNASTAQLVLALALTPTQLAFASRAPGTTSAPQTVTLTNLGMTSAVLTDIGTAGNFAHTTTCGAMLAVGASCEVALTYTPNAPMQRRGALTITSNAPRSPQRVALVAAEGARGDLDADGKSDVLLRHMNGTNYFWSIDGANIANLSLHIPSRGYLPGLDPSWSIAGVGDFNADGKADVLLRHANGTNYVWHLDGANIQGGSIGIASQGYLPGLDPSWSIAGVGDFNGDGKSDVLLRYAGAILYVWHLDGSNITDSALSIVSEGYLPALDPNWTIVGVADFDADGKSDLLLRHLNGTNRIWLLDGETIVSTAVRIVREVQLQYLDPSWTIAGVGDFNGDGKADVLLRHTNGTNYVWQLDGANIQGDYISIVSHGYLPGLDGSWSFAAVGDFNGDGKSDVLLRHTNGTDYIWHLDGANIVNETLGISSQGYLPSLDAGWSIIKK